MTDRKRDRGVINSKALALVANASAGLFGVQIVWGLQGVATSRVFQSLGAEMADLPLLWIAAPVTGLLVHPVVGWLSDRTRGRFGRRRPYIALGALMTAAAMVLMGCADSLSTAVLALWLLTLSVNVAMQPMRALVADLVGKEDLNRAYALQVLFIGAGAIFASCLPWLLTRLTSSSAQGLDVGPSWRLAFLVGAVVFLAAVTWTLARTRETGSSHADVVQGVTIEECRLRPGLWVAAGAAVAAVAAILDVRREVYLLAGVLALYGVLQRAVFIRGRRDPSRPLTGVLGIVASIAAMPVIMRRLAMVQFFTWFALFTLWVYAVPSIAAHQYGNARPGSPVYEAAADWVGVLFGVQDAVAIGAAMFLPWFVRKIGVARCHAACLAIGALCFASMSLVPGGGMLVLPWAGVGLAWASILSAPYAIVAAASPADRVGVNLGVHNIFLVLPQLVGASLLGVVVQRVFEGRMHLVLPLAGLSFFIAAVLALRLRSDRRGGELQCNILH